MKITKARLKQMIKEEARLIEQSQGQEELERAMYNWVMKNNFFMSTQQMQEFVLGLLEKASDDLRAR
jgi:hypothetical protein